MIGWYADLTNRLCSAGLTERKEKAPWNLPDRKFRIFFWFGGIPESASGTEFPVSLCNHLGFITWLLYSSTPHSPENILLLRTGWAQNAWLQWSHENWYFHLDISRWLWGPTIDTFQAILLLLANITTKILTGDQHATQWSKIAAIAFTIITTDSAMRDKNFSLLLHLLLAQKSLRDLLSVSIVMATLLLLLSKLLLSQLLLAAPEEEEKGFEKVNHCSNRHTSFGS